MKFNRIFIYLIVIAFILIFLSFILSTQRVRYSPPITSAVGDARHLAMELLTHQNKIPGKTEGDLIVFEDLLPFMDDEFREAIVQRIEEEVIIFVPQAFPVEGEEKVLCLVFWDDKVVVINGNAYARSYQTTTRVRQ